jgi:hypothetical protein
MDLFLGSQGLGALAGWLDGLTDRPRRALLIPTAGNPMPQTPWVDVAETAMTAEGLAVRRLDLEPATPDEVVAARGRTELYSQIIAAEGDRYDFVPIRDDQAVIVRGGVREVRSS